MLNKKKQWAVFLLVNLGLLLLLLIFPLYEKLIMPLSFNQCASVPLFHLYCPGCGGTRAFQSLISFDLLSAFRYNPIVPIGAVWFICYEIYMVVCLIKVPSRKIFFSRPLFIAVMVLWCLYFIIRNVLLFFGVDIIGDIVGISDPSAIELLFGVLF